MKMTLYEVIEMKQEEILWNRLKTKSENSNNTKAWISYGKVCGLSSALKFNNKMKEIYGDKCYEMRAESPDSEGCRMMYHRAC